ncbi:hypothetical protein D3C75_420160 [compost metagenome]
MIDTPDLYDPNPRTRWIAARQLRVERPQEVAAEIARRYDATWPRFWWGVINPWLVFVGPSPGNSGSRPIDWARERMPTIGDVQVHFKEYDDSAGFWSRMREWTTNAYTLAGIFPNEPDAALSSVLLANLVPINQGDSGKIDKADIEAAIPDTVTLLAKLCPRVIVPMDKRISHPLLAGFLSLGFQVESGPISRSVPAKSQTYTHYKPSTWKLKAPSGALVIAESPQHPSKRNFYDPQEVDNYLASVLAEANAS